MHFFAISSILIVISTLTMAIILFLSAHKPKENLIWAYFCIFVSIWGLGGYFGSMTLDKDKALFWWQIANIGSIFCPIVFYHFILEYLKRKERLLLIICYWAGIILTIVNFFFSDLYLGEISIIFNQFYYMDWVKDKNIIYLLFYIGFYWLLLLYSFALLLKDFFSAKGPRRNQMKYFIVGMSIGWLGGCADFMIIFGIPVYPYSNILIAIYPVILGYAMSRFHLMDIKIAFTRLSIFFLVYSIVLGIPFGLAIWGQEWLKSMFAENWFWTHTIILLLSATSGPFIYLYIQKKTEEKIFQEEKRMQDLLMNASYGMNTIHDAVKLFKLIINVIVKILKVRIAAIYILDADAKQYDIKNTTLNDPIKSIPATSPLISWLLHKKLPVVYEEIKLQSDIENANEIASLLMDMSASVVVPIIVNNTLLGFIILGERDSNEMYSRDLLNILAVLGNQAALAIENCQFLEAEKELLKKEGARARRESLDMLVSTMAHEIDNPIQGAIGQAEMLKMCIDFFRHNLPKETIDEIYDYCEKINFNCQRVSKIVKAVENYSKRETGNLKKVDFDAVIVPYHSLIPMVQKQYKAVEYIENIEQNLPLIWAEEIMIEEILMNLVENAYHAVIHNTSEMKVQLSIFKKDDDFVRLEVKDNGYGIAPKIKKQLFQVPTTTKGSSEGTGLGLYRVRQICEVLKAKYGADSDGRGFGAIFYVEIPIFNENSQPKEENHGK